MDTSISPNDEKRIYNIIWNASKDYDFIPAFVGLDIAGNPDFYLNIIIGLAYKIFPKKDLDSLFDNWKYTFRRDLLDNLTWLVLENIIFHMEKDKRINLVNLRREFALNFWADKNIINRNSLALKRSILYDFYALRTEEILGVKKAKASLGHRKFYEKLTTYKYKNFKELKNFLLSAYKEQFIFLTYDENKRIKKLGFLSNYNLVTSGQIEYSIRSSELTGDIRPLKNNRLSRYLFNLALKRKKDREREIEDIFGQSIFSEKKLIDIEKKYCIKGHDKLHIWYSRGDKSKRIKSSKINNLLASVEVQKKKNLDKYKKNINLYNREITNLSRKLNRSLLDSLGESSDLNKSGSLEKSLAWKMLATNQRKIFSKKTIEKMGGFEVDLLLDASASRLRDQTDIAIEAYILASSLYNCNIGVRIISYNTIYDYTSLLILKDWDEKPNLERILSYYPMGWNRDGLAYRAYLELLPEKVTNNHLTIIMTDASPNDLMPYKTGIFNKGYDSELALEDSLDAILKIRRRGIKVAGMITGGKASSENARKLFHTNFIKFDDIRQISNICAKFIQKEIGRSQ